MEMETTIRQCGKLSSRLFDHRPIISSEIHQFLQEFETKKVKRDKQNLTASLAIATDLTERQLPAATLLIEDHAPRLLGSVQVGARMVEKIAEKRLKNESLFAEEREANRKRREAAWNAFMEDLCEESNQIERDYEEGRRRIDNFYGDLNKQMASQG